jgi:hypothetical protein
MQAAVFFPAVIVINTRLGKSEAERFTRRYETTIKERRQSDVGITDSGMMLKA